MNKNNPVEVFPARFPARFRGAFPRRAGSPQRGFPGGRKCLDRVDVSLLKDVDF